MKPVGSKQRKPKTGYVDQKNPAIEMWRKRRKLESERRQAEDEKYNSLCGPVTITYINK
jgi:hypothetical protein